LHTNRTNRRHTLHQDLKIVLLQRQQVRELTTDAENGLGDGGSRVLHIFAGRLDDRVQIFLVRLRRGWDGTNKLKEKQEK
jgi:hypothetical protein